VKIIAILTEIYTVSFNMEALKMLNFPIWALDKIICVPYLNQNTLNEVYVVCQKGV